MSEDQFDIDDELLEDEQQSPKETLKRLWDENPLFKVGVVVVGIVVLYVGYSVFFTDEKNNIDRSSVPGAQTVTSAPGEEDTDPEYQEALEAANRQRAEEAAQAGGSSLPTPIGTSDARIEAPDLEDMDGENPLEVWQRRSDAVNLGRNDFADEGPESSGPSADFDLGNPQMSLTPHQQMQPRMPQQTIAAPKGNEENIERFAEQMRTIISTKQPPAPNLISMADYPSPYAQYLEQQEEMKERQEAAMVEGAQSTGPSTPYLEEGTSALEQEEDQAAEEKKEKVIIPAGTIVYAQVLNALNSDIKSPVLAQILSGPLTGSRAIGSFELQDEYLVLSFERIVDGDDVYSTEAYALDTGTTLAGMRSDVDRHWIRRVVIPAAAEFIAGMGTAIAESGSTSVTVDQGAAVSEQSDLDTRQELATGVEAGADKLSEILEEDEDVEVTVTLNKGTPIGIVFTESIKEGDLE